MESLLASLLPRFGLIVEPLVFAFNGKADLEKKAPDRMRSWHDAPGVEPRFIVVRDNDGADCRAVKARIIERCRESRHPFIVRLVMQELEAWFFGDLAAVAAAYGKPKLSALSGQERYRDPDRMVMPSRELARLLADGGKVDRAERIAPHMDIERNTSVSFRVFCEGVRKMAGFV